MKVTYYLLIMIALSTTLSTFCGIERKLTEDETSLNEVFNKKNIDSLSNFHKYEWLTFEILNNHYKQIDYCLKKGIFTSCDVLEFLAKRKQSPIDVVPHHLSHINDEKTAVIYGLAKEHNNKKLRKIMNEISIASRILVEKKNKSSVVFSEDMVKHITSYF